MSRDTKPARDLVSRLNDGGPAVWSSQISWLHDARSSTISSRATIDDSTTSSCDEEKQPTLTTANSLANMNVASSIIN